MHSDSRGAADSDAQSAGGTSPGESQEHLIHRPGIRTEQSLKDLIAFAEDAAELVAYGEDTYHANRMLRLAGEAIVTRIGEAMARIDERVAREYPSFPLRQARAMRNIVAHDYARTDPAIIWATLEHDVPQLARQARDILRRR